MDQTLPPDDPMLDAINAFEGCGQENGERYWWQSDLCRLLGYKPGQGFEKAAGRAMATCSGIGLPVVEHFRPAYRDNAGELVSDMKLSRFACYLIALNGDPSKTEVAHAQAYFVTWAHAAEMLFQQMEGVQRVAERDEVTSREKSLNSTAKAAGVENYAFFQNKGYVGLYNMSLARLKELKGIPTDRTPLDFMGREEMAANLFRITQTEAKIKSAQVKGQMALENTAFTVGRQVRQAIAEIGGAMPENLPAREDIKQVRSGLKRANKQISKIDAKQLPKPE
jgi:DNA-damage-inducible protein D